MGGWVAEAAEPGFTLQSQGVVHCVYTKVSLYTVRSGRGGVCILGVSVLTVQSSSQPPGDSGSPSVPSKFSEVLWEHSSEGSLVCPCASPSLSPGPSPELGSLFIQVVGVLKAPLESGVFSEGWRQNIFSVPLRPGVVLAELLP